jgi:DNA-binding transcriptional MerR regulator
MNIPVLSTPLPCSISDVERDTGVAKETLRVWERRYAFPKPERDPFGERLYPLEQVHKLRLVKRLIDLGYRPGKVIGCTAQELQALAEKTASGSRPRQGTIVADLEPYLELSRHHESDALRRKLSQALLVMGLRNFVVELMAPLTTSIGDAWACGEFDVWEEHLFTETVQMVLRSAIFSVPPANVGGVPSPRILLTTTPQEKHGLGLLMSEALMVADGARCLSLGVQTPLPDIVEAARTLRADIVALSFSTGMNTRQVLDALKELRARLPDAVAIWAGGANAALRRRAPGFVQVMALQDIGGGLADWRLRNRSPVLS